MKRYIIQSLILGITVLFAACSGEKTAQPQTIAVDFNNETPLDLTASSAGTKYVKLESSTEAFSKNIKSLYIVNDTIIRVGHNKISAFDGQGKYLFDYVKMGQGPQEFVCAGNTFLKEGKLYLYDNCTRRLLKFSVGGRFIESIACQSNEQGYNPAYILPFPHSEDYMVLPTFIGTPGAFTPLFGLYDKELKAVKFSASAKTHSYTNAYNSLVPFDDGFLFSDAHSYDLLYVDKNLEPVLKYTVDYGQYALAPSLYEKGPQEIAKALSQGSDQVKGKSIGVKYLNNTKDRLYFICYAKGLKIVSYDKTSGQTKLFSPQIDPELRLTGFLTVIDDKIVMAAENKENLEENYTLVIYPLEKLL